MAVLHRGTPLYGQPAWWGDGDAEQPARPEEKIPDRKREKPETGWYSLSSSTEMKAAIDCMLEVII